MKRLLPGEKRSGRTSERIAGKVTFHFNPVRLPQVGSALRADLGGFAPHVRRMVNAKVGVWLRRAFRR
jgi:hypothetical protein